MLSLSESNFISFEGEGIIGHKSSASVPFASRSSDEFEEVVEPEADQVTIKKRKEPTAEERRTSLREEGAEINCLVARTALILPFTVPLRFSASF